MLAAMAVVGVAVALASSDSAGVPADAGATRTPAPRAAADVLPTRNHRARVVEPVAGESAASGALPVEASSAPPAAAASATALPRLKRGTGPTSDAAVSQ